MTRTVADMKSTPGTVVAALSRYHPLQHSASAHSYVGSEYSAAPSPISGQRSTAKSPLLQEAKFLPPEPSVANQSEEPEEGDEDEEEEEDDDEDEEDGEEGGVGEQEEGVEDKEDRDGDDDEDGEEGEERANDNEYVAAVCQYTTVLKETPPGFDDKKYEVNYMNLEQGAAATNIKEPENAWPSLHVTEKKKDEERRSTERGNERLIEYCEEEEEEEHNQELVSGKLAIHLDTGETSREFCINRVQEQDGHSRRSQTREESVTCGSELEKPLFIKKYQGRFFQTDVETSSEKSDNEAPPVPPPRSKSKESSVVVVGPGQKTDRCCSPGLECNLIYDSVAADPDKVMEATSSARATDARLPGSFGEGKNVEYLEKKEVKSVESSDRSQSKSSSSDKVKARLGSGGGVYRRLGVVSMPPAPDLGEEGTGQNEGARRISLDDLSDAFRGLNGATKKAHSGTSIGCTKGTSTVVYNDYQSDDSILEERADSITKSGNCHRRSKSEESLLDRAEARLVKEGTGSQSRSRRNSPLSHSSSVHQHLVRGNTPDRCGGVGAYNRRSQSRDRSLSKDQDGSSHAIKSRIPVPVRSLHDKEDVSSSIGEVLSDSHYVASPEPNSRALDSHHSYVSSRYSDRYQPSTYISSYVPHYSTHEYNPHTSSSSPYTSYRPTSAKDYTSRYNNFYSPAPVDESSSFLTTSGSTSPRWRRRSYDHDSDYLRYQRRTSRPISDYPAPSSSAATSAALNRSRSRSRVSDYDAYTRREPTESSYLSTYSSRPSQSNYLYGHSYSNYHEGGNGGGGGEVTMVSRQPRPPEYPPQSAEVSARTRRYQPDK